MYWLIGDIYEDIERVRDTGNYDITYVTNVFLVCGGNDVENIKHDKDITFVYDDFEDIVYRIKETFPNAKINIFSLIPRKAPRHQPTVPKKSHYCAVLSYRH